MSIAERLIDSKIEPDNNELKFLLWCALVQLGVYQDEVSTAKEEAFNIEEVLDALDIQLGMLP